MSEDTTAAADGAEAPKTTDAPETTESTVQETETKVEAESEGKQEPDKNIARKSYENRQLKRQLKTQSQELREVKDVLNEIKARMVSENQSNIPELGNFDTVEEWGKALLEHDKKSTPEPVSDGLDPEYKAWVDDSKEFLFEIGSEKYEDFEEVVTGDTTITEWMRDAMFDMDNQVEIAYFLGKNPKEARRIAKLPPRRQVAEIGKLDGKPWSPSKPKTSAAPAPIEPVGGSNTPNDTIQPQMKFEDYLKVRNRNK